MEIMHKQIFPALAIILLVLAAGCIQPEEEQKETIKIGASLPLTGEAASYGQNALAGITLAINEVNDNGGINGRKIELIAEDDKCTAEGVNGVTKLATVDNVVGLLGPICSAAAGPALPIAQSNGLPAINIYASAPQLNKIGNYIFRVVASDAFQGKYGAELVYSKLGKKKAAILYVKNDWGQGMKDVFKEEFTGLGGEIVYESGVLQTETDFRTDISKIKESGAEVVYALLYPAGAVAAFKQMGEMSFNIQVVGGDAFGIEEVVGSGYGNGVIYTYPKINIPEEFKQKINSLPGFENLQVATTAPLGYDAAKIMFNAIEKAGTDRKAIRDALAQTHYEGISNPVIEFDETGDLKSAVYEVKVIKDKKSENYE